VCQDGVIIPLAVIVCKTCMFRMVLMGLTKVSSEEIGILGSVYAIPWVFHLGFAFGLPLLFQLVHQKGWCSGTIDWAQNLLLGRSVCSSTVVCFS